MNLTEIKITSASELNRNSFTAGNVTVTPRKRFNIYFEGDTAYCDLVNWSREHECHVIDMVSMATVDGKPMYFIETRKRECEKVGQILVSRSFKTIKEVKAAI